MSRSVRPDYESLRERQARAQESIVTAPVEMTPMQSAVGRTFAAVMTYGHGSPEAKKAAADFMKAFDDAHPEFNEQETP